MFLNVALVSVKSSVIIYATTFSKKNHKHSPLFGLLTKYNPLTPYSHFKVPIIGDFRDLFFETLYNLNLCTMFLLVSNIIYL